MINDKMSSASRVFSLIKNSQNSSPIRYNDNENNPHFQNNKDKEERGEFLKKLIQNEEDDEIENSQNNNYNIYSNPKKLYLNEKNESYRNSIRKDSEQLNNKYSNSKNNTNLDKENSLDKNNDNDNSEESKRPKNKKKLSIKKRNTRTVLIKNKSAKMSFLKKMNNLDKLKNTILSKYSIGNITDDKDTGINENNIISNLNKSKEKLINDEIAKVGISENFKYIDNNNFIHKNSTKIENKRNDNLEQLKMGDVVILINLYTDGMNAPKKEEDIIFNEGIVYPEIIVSKQIFCLPLNKLNDSHRCKSIFKRSLFRIEAPQNNLLQNQIESLNNSYKKTNNNKNLSGTNEQVNLNLLSRKSIDEKKYNESEIILNHNKKILYGTIIQLRNIFTNELLTIDLDYHSKQIGCLDVVLNPLGGENSQFILAPSNCLYNFGEPIFYNDPFIIIPSCLEINHFIHVKNSEDVKGIGFELNVSRKKSIFKLLLYEAAELNRKSSIKNEIKSTMVVKLFNTELNGFLSASIYNIDKILPKLKINQKMDSSPLIDEYKSDTNNDNSSEENEEEDNSDNSRNIKIIKSKNKKNIIYNNFIIKKGKKDNSLNNSNNSEKSDFNKETYFKIILDSNDEIPDNCLIYWEIQYEKPFEGKVINSEYPIRFRHIASGLYLAYDNDKREIFLSQQLNDNSIFYIYNEEKEKNNKKLPIINEDQIYLRAKNTNMFLKAYENKDKNIPINNLTLSKDNKIKHENFVFKIQLYNNSLIQINYNSNLIINHLINLYEQINVWGIKETKGPDLTKVFIYDYYTALQGEINFKKMVNFYRDILLYIKNGSIKASNNINIFINFQNYHTDQGLLFFLLNFILLFDSKTLYNREGKNGFLNIKDKAYPDNIAKKHIGDVIELTFSLIKILIKNNSHSSKNIFNCLYLFDELLKNHHLETIEIFVICLKNTYTNSLNINNNLYNSYFSQEFVSPNESYINYQKFHVLTSTQHWIK